MKNKKCSVEKSITDTVIETICGDGQFYSKLDIAKKFGTTTGNAYSIIRRLVDDPKYIIETHLEPNGTNRRRVKLIAIQESARETELWWNIMTKPWAEISKGVLPLSQNMSVAN